MQRSIGKDQFGVVQAQQFLVLTHNAVLGLGEHPDQGFLVQRVQHSDHRQTADEFGDQAKLDQIVRFHLAQQFLAGLILIQIGAQLAAEAQGRSVGALLDELFQTVKGTAADKQNVLGVDLDELLLRVLAAALGRHVADGTFQDLQQSLLNALAAHVAGDGWVLALAGDLVDLVHIDDADLRFGDVEIRRLDQLEQNVLHVFAHVAGLGEGGGVRDGEGHTQHLGQGLGQQGLAGAGGAQHEHIGLLQFHVALLPGENPFVVVVDRDSQHLFGFVLADDILIQPRLDFGRGEDVDVLQRGRAEAARRWAVARGGGGASSSLYRAL